jgi:hypothetical protein
MLLEAKHLSLEHRYNALRMDVHDIRLHDFGTVCGLRVDRHPSPDCVNQYAILRPGLALDCCGRQILVPEDLYVPLFDGAKSGWCGAPISVPPTSTPPGTPPVARTTLYVYLRFRQCDTDPIPAYVKNCGCCGETRECDCTGQSGDPACVLSVTREGYEVTVSTTPPPVWRNPVSTAFCAWLATQLKGAQSGLPNASDFVGISLQQALCQVITNPCPDTCGGGNDVLLLATITFNPDDTLASIDNCSNRRLVLSTGALYGSLVCLAEAAIACCGQKAGQLPKIQLSGNATPGTVDLSVVPLSTTITYAAVATNTSPTDAVGPFTLQVLVDPRLTVTTSTSSVGGNPGPAPVAVVSASGTTVSVSVPAGLPQASNATMNIVANFTPTAMKDGDVVTSTASVVGYAGPSDGPDSLTTTFKNNVVIDGPRVVYAKLSQWLQGTSVPRNALPGLLGEAGIEVPFDRVIDTKTAVTQTAATPPDGTIRMTVVDGATQYPVFLNLIWPAGGPPPTSILLRLRAAELKQLDTLLMNTIPATDFREGLVSLNFSLLGGVKGAATTPQLAITAPDGTRLDGEPAKGGPPGQKPGRSGDGTQGGDFTLSIRINP